MSLIGAIGIFAMLMALAGWGLLSLFGGSSGPNSTPPLGVTGVSFTCTSAGKGIQATLTFVSTTSVTATLRAGDTTTTKTGAGSVSVTIVGTAGPSDCWAAIDGMNRPGFGGRSDSTEGWSYASTKEVSG